MKWPIDIGILMGSIKNEDDFLDLTYKLILSILESKEFILYYAKVHFNIIFKIIGKSQTARYNKSIQHNIIINSSSLINFDTKKYYELLQKYMSMQLEYNMMIDYEHTENLDITIKYYSTGSFDIFFNILSVKEYMKYHDVKDYEDDQIIRLDNPISDFYLPYYTGNIVYRLDSKKLPTAEKYFGKNYSTYSSQYGPYLRKYIGK